MIIGVPKETAPGERRVALVPAAIAPLAAAGCDVLVESGAGEAAGYPDAAYTEKGARLAKDRAEVLGAAQIILAVRAAGASPSANGAGLSNEKTLIAFLDPLGAPQACADLSRTGVAAFSMELMPRITRAQGMDALSSMATLAGYQAALLAAVTLPRMFPMMMTAAGTVPPARVFVVGAGVAGLQAIATSKRLGAKVEAYDVRPAAAEQIASVGAKPVVLELETSASEDKGGYAKAQDEEFYRRQRELLTSVVARNDVVITTAAVPGKKAPILITGEMVSKMPAGSVIVDLAAERGGNCELTKPDETVQAHGVTILGPTNLPSQVAYHASQMYAKNISTFLLHLLKEGKLSLDTADEITRETLVTREGEVVHLRVRELLGLASPAAAEKKE